MMMEMSSLAGLMERGMEAGVTCALHLRGWEGDERERRGAVKPLVAVEVIFGGIKAEDALDLPELRDDGVRERHSEDGRRQREGPCRYSAQPSRKLVHSPRGQV
jgi:hypothetical protein